MPGDMSWMKARYDELSDKSLLGTTNIGKPKPASMSDGWKTNNHAFGQQLPQPYHPSKSQTSHA